MTARLETVWPAPRKLCVLVCVCQASSCLRCERLFFSSGIDSDLGLQLRLAETSRWVKEVTARGAIKKRFAAAFCCSGIRYCFLCLKSLNLPPENSLILQHYCGIGIQSGSSEQSHSKPHALPHVACRFLVSSAPPTPHPSTVGVSWNQPKHCGFGPFLSSLGPTLLFKATLDHLAASENHGKWPACGVQKPHN